MRSKEQILSMALENEDVIAFLQNNKLSSDFIEINYLKFYDFLQYWTKCSPGPLKDCKQEVPGYKKILEYKNNLLYVQTTYCEHFLYENHNYIIKENFIYADFDVKNNVKTIGEYAYEHKGDDKIIEPSRVRLIRKFKEIINATTGKGFYIYGEPGVGKTYISKLIANNYAYKGLKVAFITVSNLIRKVKSDFSSQEQTGSRLLNNLTYVDVLFLDDFGSEKKSIWVRDELLFGLLNYRMENNKLTFLTSNFSIKQLSIKYRFKFGNEVDQSLEDISHTRFMERLESLTSPIHLLGENWRKK